MRILGLDPGLQVTGYAVLEVADAGPKVRDAGVIRSGDKRETRDIARRIKTLYDGLCEVLDEWKPAAMAVEQLYAHYDHPRTAILMAHARGAFFLAGAQRGIPVLSYAATNVKKVVTGSGRASKEQMQHAVARELGLAKHPEPHDVADALAVALCHYFASANFYERIASGHLHRRQSQGAPRPGPGRNGRRKMITKMTGVLTRVLDDEARLQVGAIEYQLLVPETVRRLIQMRVGQEATFHTTEYLEGNSGGSRFVPRRIGFNTEAEVEFFDLFCTVEKIGAKKALKAMARPVKEIADAISRQDAKWLSTLPGIGATTAEQIVTTLKRKVTKYAMMNGEAEAEAGGPGASNSASRERKRPEDIPTTDGKLIDDVYQALMSLGHNPLDAHNRLDGLLTSGKSFRNVQDAITLIYSHKV